MIRLCSAAVSWMHFVSFLGWQEGKEVIGVVLRSLRRGAVRTVGVTTMWVHVYTTLFRSEYETWHLFNCLTLQANLRNNFTGFPEHFRGINVLSLFDGVGCALVALNKLGLVVNQYFSSEIDIHCRRVLDYNHKDSVVHLGCVTQISAHQLKCMKIDLLIGGNCINCYLVILTNYFGNCIKYCCPVCTGSPCNEVSRWRSGPKPLVIIVMLHFKGLLHQT